MDPHRRLGPVSGPLLALLLCASQTRAATRFSPVREEDSAETEQQYKTEIFIFILLVAFVGILICFLIIIITLKRRRQGQAAASLRQRLRLRQDVCAAKPKVQSTELIDKLITATVTKKEAERAERKQAEEASPDGGPPPSPSVSQAPSIPEDETCNICFERERNVAFLPCKHSLACGPCTNEILMRDARCPLCRSTVEKLVISETKSFRNTMLPSQGSLANLGPESLGGPSGSSRSVSVPLAQQNDPNQIFVATYDGHQVRLPVAEEFTTQQGVGRLPEAEVTLNSVVVVPGAQHTTADGDPTQAPESAVEIAEAMCCTMCMELLRTVRFFPCRHSLVCRPCANTLLEGDEGCPLCQAEIEGAEEANITGDMN